jgi:ABC-type Mn2+/Zn2+ transport system ATPase subunit
MALRLHKFDDDNGLVIILLQYKIMKTESVVTIEGLSVSYDNRRVLTNIFLDIEPGHVYGVVGPNGAGKSTLFKSILGLTEISSGKIKIFGQDLKEVRLRTAYVPQKDDIDWTFPATVKDIVLMGRYPHKSLFQRLSKSDYELADQAMEELEIIDLQDRQIGLLSGGQQQRVFIARALCQQADLFFFDEPFVGVDITTEEKTIQIMKNLASQNKTLLVVHHDLITVPSYFSKLIMINQRLIAFGDTSAIFTNDNIAKCYGAQLTLLQKHR